MRPLWYFLENPLPPSQREGDHEVVEGVCFNRQDTPPVSFADSPLWEGAKNGAFEV